MSRPIKTTLLALLAFTVSLPCLSQGIPLSTAEAAGLAEEVITEKLKADNIPGLTAAVAVDGQIVWQKGFGYADIENRIPVTPLTRMRTASISKAMTAGLLAKMVDEGTLDLDAPVRQYVSAFPEKSHPVTIRQVAGHLGGIRHYKANEFASTTHYKTVTDALGVFKDDPLMSEPGTEFLYSSYGWNLLSAVAESVGGALFLDLMDAHVFDALGMRNTMAEIAASIVPHRSRYYQKGVDDALRNAPYVDNSIKWAGGGFMSTAGDLVRFGHGFLSGQLSSEETVTLFTTPQKTKDGKSHNYGIGWARMVMDGKTYVGHSGGAMGASSILIAVPEKNVVVALICNLQGGGLTPVGAQIADAFAGR